MAGAAKGDGQDKVIATAQHIVKSLANSKFAEEDMIRILSGFDNRLSDLFPSTAPAAAPAPAPSTSSPPPTTASPGLAAIEQVILRWDASGPDSLLWESSAEDAAEYLATVDDLISLYPVAPDLRARTDSLLQISMARLEEEFRHLMIRNTVPLEPRGLYSSMSRLSVSMASDGGDAVIEDFDASSKYNHQRENNIDASRSWSGSGSALLEELNVDLIRLFEGLSGMSSHPRRKLSS